jgi:hypothetical protein
MSIIFARQLLLAVSIIFAYCLLTSFAFRIPRGAHFIRPRATVAARLVDNFCAAKIIPNQG